MKRTLSKVKNLEKFIEERVQDKQKFNNKIKEAILTGTGTLQTWIATLSTESWTTAAKSEPLVIKRLLILNAFEHIAAMEMSQTHRKLDYADYFVRQNVSFEDDKKISIIRIGYIRNNHII